MIKKRDQIDTNAEFVELNGLNIFSNLSYQEKNHHNAKNVGLVAPRIKLKLNI